MPSKRMNWSRNRIAFAAANACACLGAIAVLTFGTTGCQKSGNDSEDEECVVDTSYNPSLAPAAFAAGVENALWPLVPGTRYVFANATERIEVTVTNDTRQIQGIQAMVVRDTVTENGALIEDTYDWYARDSSGNVWYLGEDTTEYEGGKAVGKDGSWEAGVDGAKAGIVMHGTQPAIGKSYRQEYYACEAEDMAEVISLNESVTVPYGNYTGCLKTREFTPLEPDVNEHKYYCPGVGLVLEVDVKTGARTELVDINTL